MDDKLKKKIIYELIKTFINAGDIALELREKGLKKIIKDDNSNKKNICIIKSLKLFLLIRKSKGKIKYGK